MISIKKIDGWALASILPDNGCSNHYQDHSPLTFYNDNQLACFDWSSDQLTSWIEHERTTKHHLSIPELQYISLTTGRACRVHCIGQEPILTWFNKLLKPLHTNLNAFFLPSCTLLLHTFFSQHRVYLLKVHSYSFYPFDLKFYGRSHWNTLDQVTAICNGCNDVFNII